MDGATPSVDQFIFVAAQSLSNWPSLNTSMICSPSCKLLKAVQRRRLVREHRTRSRAKELLLARGARREARGPARASRRTPRPQEGCVAITAAPRLQVWGGYVSLRRRRSPEAGGAYAGEIQRAVAFAKGARLRG